MKRTEYPIHSEFKSLEDTFTPLDRTTLPMIQEMIKPLFLQESSSAELEVEQKTIPIEGNGMVQALWYSPKDLEGVAPCLIYCHGGGYVMPGAPYHFSLVREYSKRARCRVLFVDYRLAPEHPFPAATEDCFAAYCWVLDHAQKLLVEADRVAVAGDSVGACLATVICLMAKDRGRKMPCGQLLMYPVTGVDTDTESRKKYTDTPMCNSLDMEKYEAYYIQDRMAGKWEYAAPLEAESLAGLPPAYMETAEFDCLRDEGILYAERLRSYGIRTDLYNTEGTVHGFDSVLLESSIVRACVDRRIEFLKQIFLK